MRLTQLIIHGKLSTMKSKILTACLQGNYRDSLGEFNSTLCVVFGAERNKVAIKVLQKHQIIKNYNTVKTNNVKIVIFLGF